MEGRYICHRCTSGRTVFFACVCNCNYGKIFCIEFAVSACRYPTDCNSAVSIKNMELQRNTCSSYSFWARTCRPGVCKEGFRYCAECILAGVLLRQPPKRGKAKEKLLFGVDLFLQARLRRYKVASKLAWRAVWSAWCKCSEQSTK